MRTTPSQTRKDFGIGIANCATCRCLALNRGCSCCQQRFCKCCFVKHRCGESDTASLSPALAGNEGSTHGQLAAINIGRSESRPGWERNDNRDADVDVPLCSEHDSTQPSSLPAPMSIARRFKELGTCAKIDWKDVLGLTLAFVAFLFTSCVVLALQLILCGAVLVRSFTGITTLPQGVRKRDVRFVCRLVSSAAIIVLAMEILTMHRAPMLLPYSARLFFVAFLANAFAAVADQGSSLSCFSASGNLFMSLVLPVVRLVQAPANAVESPIFGWCSYLLAVLMEIAMLVGNVYGIALARQGDLMQAAIEKWLGLE